MTIVYVSEHNCGQILRQFTLNTYWQKKRGLLFVGGSCHVYLF